MSDKRLDRLLPFLSASERAAMMLRDFKAGKPQDMALLNSAPDKQAPEINRLIGMMNAANGDLANVLLVIRERVVQEELRLSWLVWAHMSALEMWCVRGHFNVTGREPITESDYREREAATRAELIPIDECAMQYTEYHHLWDDGDWEVGEDGELYPTDEAWYRVRDRKLDEMRTAVANGTLKASGKGKRLKIACGAFYDWLGVPVPVAPDLGIAFDVQPDSRTREVERSRHDHEFVLKLLERGACSLDLPLDMKAPLPPSPPDGRFGVDLARIVAVSLRSGICENWRELRAIERRLDAINEEFDGEDVLHPSVRERLDDAKAMLTDLHERVQKYTGPFELPEPDDELSGTIERIVEREMRNVPTR